MIKNKNILITGGTGSFGNAALKALLRLDPNKIIIFSRDELKQFEMQNKLKKYEKKLRYFIGDIRDKERLNLAFKDVDIVIHAAALKQVPASEYNPFETIKTNVFGTQNVVEACLNNNVKKLISLSTDKASSPINLYGASKLVADKLAVSLENIKGKSKIISAVVRYGNVMGSRGSIVPMLLKKKNEKIIQLTNSKMTRFNISISEAVDFVLFALKYAKGGEIFVPKLSSYNLVDVARAIVPKAKFNFTGTRPGEKIHEEMISYTESLNTIEYKKHFIILPSFRNYSLKSYVNKYGGKITKKQFTYSSDKNDKFLSIKDLMKIINKF